MMLKTITRMATWLLKQFGCSPNNEAILGDLVERHQQGRTARWFVRQVIVAVVTSCFEQTKENKWLVLRAVAAGWLVQLLLSPLFRESVERKIWGPPTSASIEFLVVTTVLFSGIFGAIASGWAVSRISGDHRKTAVLAYVGTALLYGTIDFFWQQLQFWRANSAYLHLEQYLIGVVLPFFLFFVVFSIFGTVLVLYGGGLLKFSQINSSSFHRRSS